MRRLVAGSRGSALALWQTNHMMSELKKAHGSALDISIEIITTRGDVDMSDRLAGTLEKGFFTVELEEALREKRVDFAVHSLKDLPTRNPEGLCLVAVPERAQPHDLLICRKDRLDGGGAHGPKFRAGARVGGSSLRRQALVAAYIANATAVPLRGNVPTRVERLARGDYDAIILARAGIERLQLDLKAFAVFALNPRVWTPAPGQGAIAVQARAHDREFASLAAPLDDVSTAQATHWERAFLAVLEGGCTTPFGCYVNKDLSRAWLGIAHAGAWLSHAVTLPSAAPNSAFIETTLAHLQRADAKRSAPDLQTEESHDGPLFQPLD